MGCPTDVVLGDNLTFTVTTHDPDTGVVTDADAVPDWWVYEDETGTAIDSGQMAKLDDTNTTGFYAETLAVTSGNGYEDHKTYSIYVEATVDSDKGAISYGFKVRPMSGFKYGVAVTVPFYMVDETDGYTPETGLTVVEEISKDGGAFAACTNTFAEVGNGVYTIDLTATEMQADVVSLKLTASGARQRMVFIKTSD